MSDYPRDMVGYGRNPPHPQWPGHARVALQIVVNYDPAKYWLTYPGAIILSLGILLLFWQKRGK